MLYLTCPLHIFVISVAIPVCTCSLIVPVMNQSKGRSMMSDVEHGKTLYE